MGLGAGIVFPLSLAVVVSAAFGDDDDRPKAIGILATAVALGLPLGPVLGGLLLQHFSWHSVFWINVPAVCATLAAGAVLMPESRNPAAPPLDAPGALLAAGAVTGLVWGVINGQEHGMDGAAHLGAAGRVGDVAGRSSWPANARSANPGHRPGAVPGQAVHLGHGGHRRGHGGAVRDLVRGAPVPAERGRRRPDQQPTPAAAAVDGRAAGRGQGMPARSCGQRAPGSPWPLRRAGGADRGAGHAQPDSPGHRVCVRRGRAGRDWARNRRLRRRRDKTRSWPPRAVTRAVGMWALFGEQRGAAGRRGDRGRRARRGVLSAGYTRALGLRRAGRPARPRRGHRARVHHPGRPARQAPPGRLGGPAGRREPRASCTA